MNFDQIYADFSTKLMPMIAQGASITKEYAFDLFGRYVQYLILFNIFWLTFGLILIVASIVIFFKIKRWCDEDRGDPGAFFVPIIIFVFGFIILVINFDFLIQDIYVPEVRILELINKK